MNKLVSDEKIIAILSVLKDGTLRNTADIRKNINFEVYKPIGLHRELSVLDHKQSKSIQLSYDIRKLVDIGLVEKKTDSPNRSTYRITADGISYLNNILKTTRGRKMTIDELRAEMLSKIVKVDQRISDCKERDIDPIYHEGWMESLQWVLSLIEKGK